MSSEQGFIEVLMQYEDVQRLLADEPYLKDSLRSLEFILEQKLPIRADSQKKELPEGTRIVLEGWQAYEGYRKLLQNREGQAVECCKTRSASGHYLDEICLYHYRVELSGDKDIILTVLPSHVIHGDNEVNMLAAFRTFAKEHLPWVIKHAEKEIPAVGEKYDLNWGDGPDMVLYRHCLRVFKRIHDEVVLPGCVCCYEVDLVESPDSDGNIIATVTKVTPSEV